MVAMGSGTTLVAFSVSLLAARVDVPITYIPAGSFARINGHRHSKVQAELLLA